MDFLLDDNLDLKSKENVLGIQENGETNLLSALFTDARENEQRGYWLDINSSNLWIFDQARLTNDTAININESAKEATQNLITDEVFSRIDTKAFLENGIMTLEVKAFNQNQVTINRKFAI